MTLEERIEKEREHNDWLAREILRLEGESLAAFDFDGPGKTLLLASGRSLPEFMRQKEESDQRLISLRQQQTGNETAIAASSPGQKKKSEKSEPENAQALAVATGERSADTAESKSTNTTAAPFTHSEDYRSVTVRGVLQTLTSRQAQVIQILHEAHEKGMPDVAIGYILELLETPNSRWQDTFKGNRDAKEALIESGERKGTLRLKII